MSDDVTENGGFGGDARTGGVVVVDALTATTSSSNANANVHLIQNQIDDDDDDLNDDDDETDARGQRRRVLKDATALSLYGLRREGTTASLWAAMKLRDDNQVDAFAFAAVTTKNDDAASDVDLYATKCALYRSHVESSRAIARGALLRWKLACGPRVSAARVADAAVRARERRAARRAFDRWCAQTPGVSRRRRRRRHHGRMHHGRGISFGGDDDDDDDDGGMTPVDFLNDDEFPTDYRDELEIRLKQIARLEDALREANAREARAASGEAFEEEMRKFRSHLTNVQRELENVKRERDAYKKKWTESSGPAALKSLEERRANQRTMATQTTFDDGDDDAGDDDGRKEKAAAVANATPATKSEIRAAEKKWMDQARLFQQKFERQMEITSDFERKLREERTRLLRSETRYEARIQEMATKHAEEIIEMRSRRVKEDEEDDARRMDAEDELTYASPASLDNDRFAEYAKIGAARGRADERNDHDSDVYESGRSRSSSPVVEETFSTPVGVRGSDAVAAASEHPERFETASKRLHFASLDDFSSSSEDEKHRGDDDDNDDDMNRRGIPQPPSVSAGTTRKPIRLTVAVAKLVMMGHSQRDAIDALKRVDGNDVQAADAWLKTRT